MSKMKLYYDGLSQPCRAVHIFLKSNDIDFELHKINVPKGESRTPEFLAVNPFGGVPCLVDDGMVLTESVAIMMYLCDKFKSIPQHWYPKDAKKRAKINQFLCWYPSTLRRLGSEVFLEKGLRPFFNKKPVDEEAYKQHVEKLEPELKKFEDLYLQADGFIFGDEISIADLSATCELFQPIAGQYNMKTNHPKIADYMERVKARTQPHFGEAFKRIEFIRDRIAEGKVGLEILPTDPNIF